MNIDDLNIPMDGKADFHQPIAVGELHWAKLYFDWSQQTVGYGQCSIYLDKDGSIHAATEGMGREWLRRALHAAADKLADSAQIG